jgi:hypothetical protein
MKNVINDYIFVNFDSKLVINLVKKMLYSAFNEFLAQNCKNFCYLSTSFVI